MARYDRIARLDPPDRSEAFPGWLIFRDLAGREREGELGRRACLRFLALRAVRRVLDGAGENLDRASLEQQLDVVRAGLGQLPPRDPERSSVGACLDRITGGDPAGLAEGARAVGSLAERCGHGYAAEEFYLTSLEVTGSHELPVERLAATSALGHLFAARGDWPRAREHLRAAVTMAEDDSGHDALCVTLRELALALARSGDAPGARSVIATAGRAWSPDRQAELVAVRSAAGCALELVAGRPVEALEAGWRAIELLPRTGSGWVRSLLDLAAACRQLRLREAAEAAYAVAVHGASTPDLAIEARIELALTAAESGDREEFARRAAALVASVDPHDGVGASAIHVGLARGAMLIDALDDARSHLREALASARAAALGDAVPFVEELLSSLERRAQTELHVQMVPVPDAVRSIAKRIANLAGDLVTSG